MRSNPNPNPRPDQVVGSQLENELILVHVLMALLEALNGAPRTSNPTPTPTPTP